MTVLYVLKLLLSPIYYDFVVVTSLIVTAGSCEGDESQIAPKIY